MAYYEIVSNQQGAKAEDWPVKSTVSVADASAGKWVEQDSNNEAVQANDGSTGAAITTNQKGSMRPIWSGKESPDAVELDQVTTVYGAHEALTDGYVEDPTALGTPRPAWAKNQPVVVIDGLLAPCLVGTDEQFAVGYVKETADANSRMRFHIF